MSNNSKKPVLKKIVSAITVAKTNKPILYIMLASIFMLIPITHLILENFGMGFLTRANVSLLNRIVIFSIAALGFNILLGYSGQISLGHAAFMGIGAYLSAYLTMNLNVPFLIALLISGTVPMVIGLLLGLVALRLARLYLAIATLGLAVTIQEILKEWTGFTNGYAGLRRIPQAEILGFSFRRPEHFLILATVVLLILCIFAYNFLRSKTGRALVSMRDSEHAAQAMGVSLFKYKLTAFAISAFYVGIAGSLYAHFSNYLSPDIWDVTLSLDLLAMVVIGGLASIGGSIFGAAFIQYVPDLVRKISFLQGIRNINFIMTGLMLILIITFIPEGLSRRFGKYFSLVVSKIFRKKKSKGGGYHEHT